MPDGLDQFFTRRDVALSCWKGLLSILHKLTGQQQENIYFIEPGAGDGAFYDLFPSGENNCIGLDLEPRRETFLKQNFLTWDFPSGDFPRQHVVVVGNPPFGTRADMAVKFFNKATEMADTIAFIVPVIFRKYFIHKTLAADFRWIRSHRLPRDAFWTEKKSTYSLNAEFQIWTRIKSRHKNRRLFSPPPITHPDFLMHQYNNTLCMLKVFNESFSFAVPCQGWQDYTRRETSPDKCEKNKQWILFLPTNAAAHKRLHDDIDYGVLASKNITCIPGFRKGDIVQEYARRYKLTSAGATAKSPTFAPTGV